MDRYMEIAVVDGEGLLTWHGVLTNTQAMAAVAIHAGNHLLVEAVSKDRYDECQALGGRFQ